MKIKTKLFFGIGLLFAMILTLLVVSTIHINQLKNDSENILTDNYNSIDYCSQMLNSLNSGIHLREAQKVFGENLEKQKNTITEIGENELTDKLAADFKTIASSSNDSLMQLNLRKDIMNLMQLNMQALVRKSIVAQQTAEKSVFWISIIGTCCFLIALTLLVNLPGNIANPIKELTTSIKEIAAQNYLQRVHFEQHNEFGELASAFNTMAEKLEEYQAGNIEKLMKEKKRIEILINNMKDPVIGLDEGKKVIFMNDIALKVSGLQAESVLNKPVQDIAMNNDLVRKLVQDLFGKEKVEARSTTLKIYADNKESYFEKEFIPIKIIPTGEKAEKKIGNVILLKNITAYKELDFAKTNFIGTVSHELKTPISSLQLSLQLLKNERIGPLNEEQKNLIDSIKDDTNRLLKITGELLNMSQVETGTIQLNTIPAELNEIIEYAVNSIKSATEQKQIQVRVHQTEDMPKVLADKEKTAWVLINLLSNAIRYADENSVIKIEASTRTNNKVDISVTDEGQGILPEYLDKIFDRYFRVPGTKKEGTGLGLAISKEFIEAQGGTITVKSEYGVGSTFTVSLQAAT